MGEAESTRALSALLSDSWGITPASVEPFDAGRMNHHWRVETSIGAFVLRRYSRLRLPESIPAEQAVLGAAANAGWPVALPIVPPKRPWSALPVSAPANMRSMAFASTPFCPASSTRR